MPLISMYERDNSRVAYRILASRAVNMLKSDSLSIDDSERIPLVNLARLLEHYLYDDFADQESPGILDALATRHLRVPAPDPVVGEKSRFEDLRTSLDRARTNTFGEMSKEEVVQCLQAVLAYLARGQDNGREVSEDQLQDAQRFFSTLAQGLGAESEDG